MIGGDGQRFVFCRDNNSAAGQVVCFSEQPSGALMNGGYRRFIEDVVRSPADIEVMAQVFVHLAAGDAFQVAAGHDPGGKRHRGALHQAVYQIGLSGKDNGKV